MDLLSSPPVILPKHPTDPRLVMGTQALEHLVAFAVDIHTGNPMHEICPQTGNPDHWV
jgi:hypothetical protein